MAIAEPRIRVERGLYRRGSHYYACATAPGARQASWRSLGPIGIMRARIMRDAFAAEVHRRGRPTLGIGRRARLTFGELADEWLAMTTDLVAARALAPRALDHYELSIRLHLMPTFGRLRLDTIGHGELLDWLAAQRRAGASAWSISGRWSVLNMVLRYALRMGVIPRHPADALTTAERPKVGRRRPRVLTDIEIRALLELAAPPTREMAALTIFAGLRISEALGLTWADVDQGSGMLRVRYQLSRQSLRSGSSCKATADGCLPPFSMTPKPRSTAGRRGSVRS